MQIWVLPPFETDRRPSPRVVASRHERMSIRDHATALAVVELTGNADVNVTLAARLRCLFQDNSTVTTTPDVLLSPHLPFRVILQRLN